MNRSWLIGIAMLLTAAVAVILPGLASLEPALQQSRAVETLGGGSTTLANDNLVDVISKLPFTLDIDSVGWKNQILSLDLKVTGNDHEPQELYQNMALAISFAFQDTENIDQLLLRIVAEDKWLDSRRLLLAGDIRRTEWSLQLQQELQSAGNGPLPERLKNGFRISESELWRKQFIYP
ncbi:hypothetical protein [Paenibacillus tianjinensis]|uniref:Uncharacterized protein n=1 Tax=Paenibacillus tianjinensis TaxID=2810347 RepID=A0ABX7LB42_9BACL|nr:hypothetical protein [Paenibacillus tianjinensis]QSF43202.1 hypothetical protein JRJ22_18170 [Paenibacillus tianjinensis]